MRSFSLGPRIVSGGLVVERFEIYFQMCCAHKHGNIVRRGGGMVFILCFGSGVGVGALGCPVTPVGS